MLNKVKNFRFLHIKRNAKNLLSTNHLDRNFQILNSFKITNISSFSQRNEINIQRKLGLYVHWYFFILISFKN